MSSLPEVKGEKLWEDNLLSYKKKPTFSRRFKRKDSESNSEKSGDTSGLDTDPEEDEDVKSGENPELAKPEDPEPKPEP